MPNSGLWSRRELLERVVGAGAAVVAGQVAWGEEKRRPNVVFILTDDQNADTIGCFGGKVLTPHIDRLAKEGVRFTRAYSVSSVCTPSRYTCLTGQYASRCPTPQFLRQCPPGAQANVGFNVQITPEVPNLGKVMHDAGYVTGFVGKWHTGGPGVLNGPADGKMEDPKIARILAENHRRMVQYIQSCGFDYAASIYRGNLADHKLDALDVHNMEWVTKGAIDFIEQNKDKPFFLHICPTLHHAPAPNKSIPGDWRVTPAGLLTERPNVQAPRESILPRLKEAGIDPAMAYATWLDDAVGAVMKKLEDLGIADNTLVIYFSDNGLRQGKGTCYDGGVHTPSVMRWKGRIPAGVTCEKMVQNTDFAPTILEACGVKPPGEMLLDGQSVLPVARGEPVPWRDMVLLEIGHTRAVTTGKWKYIAVRYPPAQQKAIREGTLGRKPYHMDVSLNLQEIAEKGHPAYWDEDQLYDLAKDPQEKVNLAGKAEHAQVLGEMKQRLKMCLARFPRAFGEFRQVQR